MGPLCGVGLVLQLCWLRARPRDAQAAWYMRIRANVAEVRRRAACACRARVWPDGGFRVCGRRQVQPDETELEDEGIAEAMMDDNATAQVPRESACCAVSVVFVVVLFLVVCVVCVLVLLVVFGQLDFLFCCFSFCCFSV